MPPHASALARIIPVLLGLLMPVLPTAARAELPPRDAETEPTTFLSLKEIGAIREQIAAGRQPWRSAMDALLHRADAALASPVLSVVGQGDSGHIYVSELPYCGWTRVDGQAPDCRDGQINPQADRGDYKAIIAASQRARDLALAYVFTGDDRYAAKSIQLIEGWTVDPDTAMEPRFSNLQSRIELFITVPGLIYATDLLKTYPAWPRERQAAVHEWFHKLAVQARRFQHQNNFENWRLLLLASEAALSGDHRSLAIICDQFRSLLSRQVDANGFLVEELGRADALSYSLFALNAMVQTAELARHWSADLYHFTTPEGRSLRLVLDRHAPYAAEQEIWPHAQQAVLTSSDNMALFELAFRALGSPSSLGVITRWGRPMDEIRVLGPTTLTHSLPGDP